MLRLPRSLQGRLLLLVLGTTLSVWLATSLLTWRDARHELDELLDGHLAQSAALLVAQQVHEGDDEHVDAPTLHRYAPKVIFQLFHQGALTMRSANAPAQPLVRGRGSELDGFHTVDLQGRPWRVFSTRGAEHDVRVFVAEEAKSRQSILRAVLRGTLWQLAAALPVLGLAAWWGIHRGLFPLRALGRAVARRRADDLRPLAVPEPPGEMRPLIDALDNLFVRIASLLERERRFTGDAAHELRTPIAAIRAQAQVALNATGEEQRRHALRATLAGCDRASRLIDQLLTLTRLEADGRLAEAGVDLGKTVQRVVAQLAPAAIGQGQAVSFEEGGDCRVRGDETLLEALARNLIDNAIRYSPTAARIQVRVAREQDRVVLTVEDSGPGLSDEDMKRLGERFFRVAGNEQAGSGLGWSICQRIAQVHGGELRAVRSGALGGLCVSVALAPGFEQRVGG